MSDYIKRQDVIDIIHKEIESTTTYNEHHTQINIKFAVEELPTVDEKEIIRKTVERVVERLEGLRAKPTETVYDTILVGSVIEICKEEGGIE